MAGLLDSIAGSNDPATADPNSGLVESQRRQLLFNTLGSTGALLLAAGQNIMPAQRAQLLAQLGNVPGQTQQMSTEMAQQNLLNQRQQYVKNQNQQEKEMQAYVGTPDFTSALNSLPPVLKQMAIAKIKGGDHAGATKMVSDYVQMAIQAQREAAAERLKAPTVTHDADQNPWAYDPRIRDWHRILPVNNDPFGLNGGGGGAPVGGGTNAGAPQMGAPQAGAAPSTGPTMAGGIPVHPNYPNASASPTANYPGAFGVSGATSYGLNQLLGYFGGPTDYQASVGDAVRQYEQVRNGIKNETLAEAPGSGRLKVAYKAVDELLPDAGSLMSSPSSAIQQMVAARDTLAKQITDTQHIIDPKNGFKFPERQKAAAEMLSLRKHYDNLRLITDSMNAGKPLTMPQQGAAAGQQQPSQGGGQQTGGGDAMTGKTSKGFTTYQGADGKIYVR